MSKTNTVDLYVSQLTTDLSNGLSWLKKDDLGFGSIQDKYGANEIQIKSIMKHPKLVGMEPSYTVFHVIDDLKEDSITTKSVEDYSTHKVAEQVQSTSKQRSTRADDDVSKQPISVGSVDAELEVATLQSTTITTTDSADAFFSL